MTMTMPTTATEAPPVAEIMEWLDAPWRGDPLGRPRRVDLFGPRGISERQRRALLLAQDRGFLSDLDPPDPERRLVSLHEVRPGDAQRRRDTTDEVQEWDGWRPAVYIAAEGWDKEMYHAAVMGEPRTWGAWRHYCGDRLGRPAVMVGPAGPDHDPGRSPPAESDSTGLLLDLSLLFAGDDRPAYGITATGMVQIATLLVRALPGAAHRWIILDSDRITATVPIEDVELLAASVADLVSENLERLVPPGLPGGA